MRPVSLLLLSMTAVVGACVGARAVRTPVSAPPVVPQPAAPNVAGPWIVTSPLSQRVTMHTDAIVAFAGDGGARTDTMATSLSVSFNWASRAHRRVDGTLSDYRLGVGSAQETPLAGLSLPRAFTAETGTSGIVFRLPAETTACTDPSHSVLQQVRDAWVPLPDTLWLGREWSDTLPMVSCRDHVMLRGVTARRFRVVRGDVEAGSRLVVLIDRIARTTITGDGDQFGERVSLAGDGSGTLRYVFDPLARQFVRATGNASMVLSFKSSRRNQTVKQETRSTITWLP